MNVSSRSVFDVCLLILVNGMWAAQYAAYKVAGEKMGPLTLSAWTFLIAAIVLLPFLIWERKRNPSQPSSRPLSSAGRSLWTKQNITGFLMIGIVGLIPASALLAWGVSRSSASDAALIYLTVPVMTALLASLILGEKMTWVRWGSLLLALLGVLMLSGFDWRHLQLTNPKFLFGNILVLLACSSSSFYNVYCKELLRRFTPIEVLVYGYALAVILGVPLALGVENFTISGIAHYAAGTWLALMVLSMMSWGLAMVLWMFLLRRLDVSQASVSIYLLPFLGVLISAITVHERVTKPMIIGGLITLAGTVLITAAESPST
ncbi:MAG TPA: DMT family transporter [Terriglobia bacterium]|nr:DMT family transporter [Terriglobia bacterium]